MAWLRRLQKDWSPPFEMLSSQESFGRVFERKTDGRAIESMQSPYTLRIERCRLIGFDCGAGGSTMLRGDVGAFYATDSRIEGGFGGSPGSGNLFRVRGALVARLQNCDLVGPFRSIHDRSHRNAYVFDRCRMTRLPQHQRTGIEQPADHVRFVDCSFDYLPEADSLRRPEKRSLSELNPAWR